MDLYYYTTAETMRFILTNGDIFATHISYLNDSEEYINGLRELRSLLRSGDDVTNSYKAASDRQLNDEAYRDAIKNVPQIYSISFSKEPDLLSQWYMYAKESGIRLKMSFTQEKELPFLVKKKTQASDTQEKREISGSLKDVHYFTRIGMDAGKYNEERDEIFKTIQGYIADEKISNDVEGNIIKIWKDIAPYIKNYEFRQEKEVRLVFKAKAGGHEEDLIEYRNSQGVLIPYLDIYKEEGWPVTEIMIGPGRNQERVFNSICHFVEHARLKIPQVEQEQNMNLFLEGMLNYQIEKEKIDGYRKTITDSVKNQNIITYKSAIYDCLKNASVQEQEYLNRNYYSECGVIVRKSNAPLEF